jgi:hypothetical protein
MYLDQFKNAEGKYAASSGVEYDSPVGYIIEHEFGWCGCGRPFEAAMHVRSILALIASLHSDKEGQEWREHYQRWTEAEKSLFPHEGSNTVAYYVMDRAGLTEHGGSVPGWLTARGHEMLKDLDEIAARREEFCP